MQTAFVRTFAVTRRVNSLFTHCLKRMYANCCDGGTDLIDKYRVEVTKESLSSIISRKTTELDRQNKRDAFFVCDLGDIIRRYKNWTSKLPRVEPFYAVKANDSAPVLGILAQVGAGFDCASKGELEKVLSLKVAPSRIIYAHPYKQTSFIEYAAHQHVNLMTFDDETELHKIKNSFPDAKLVVRIVPPVTDKCVIPLGHKFGCHQKRVLRLLKLAKQLQLDVIGVSFHVGSGCYDATAYSEAVISAKEVFAMADTAGYRFSLLDIGGGFPGPASAKPSFDEMAPVLRRALDLHFPEQMGVRIIAEPGRYCVTSAFTLAVNVIAKRTISDSDSYDPDDEQADIVDPRHMYYVNDGIYSSFSNVYFENTVYKPRLLDSEAKANKQRYKSTIWGHTCDSNDLILEDWLLPELDIGDWLVFSDIGAYTTVIASHFNGMSKPKCYYILPEQDWLELNVPAAS